MFLESHGFVINTSVWLLYNVSAATKNRIIVGLIANDKLINIAGMATGHSEDAVKIQ